MAHCFRVTVQDFQVVEEFEGLRTAADYRALLEAMQYAETAAIPEAELREMCLMSLQDLDPGDAGVVVLQHDLGGAVRKGQIEQMGHSMAEERLWEQHADMALHERLFHAASLLHAASPSTFPVPEAVRVTLDLEAENDSARAILARPLPESFVVRLLADGMEPRALLKRLFEGQLAGTSFPAAASIVWTVTSEPAADGGLRIHVTSSGYWLGALRETRAYTSAAYPDEAPEAPGGA